MAHVLMITHAGMGLNGSKVNVEGAAVSRVHMCGGGQIAHNTVRCKDSVTRSKTQQRHELSATSLYYRQQCMGGLYVGTYVWCK